MGNTNMDRRSFLAAGAAGVLTLATETHAEDVTVLRLHTLVPLQTTTIVNVVGPWAKDIESRSGGRVRIELYGSMSLGGSPFALYDQAKDGVVDFSMTTIGYSPGRFPITETFELPFLMTNAERTSVALQRFVEANAMNEFGGVKLICANTHGPGLLHVNRPVERLEDLKGLKIRGGSRLINDMLSRLGAEPISMSINEMTQSLSSGVLDGTTLPWDITLGFRTSEVVHHHVEFGGANGLYTQVLVFVMNGDAFSRLPEDIQALFDETAGVAMARASGAATDKQDVIARGAAEKMGNNIVTLDEAETARWREAVQPTIEQWYADSEAAGIDGRALHRHAMDLVAEEAAG